MEFLQQDQQESKKQRTKKSQKHKSNRGFDPDTQMPFKSYKVRNIKTKSSRNNKNIKSSNPLTLSTCFFSYNSYQIVHKTHI